MYFRALKIAAVLRIFQLDIPYLDMLTCHHNVARPLLTDMPEAMYAKTTDQNSQYKFRNGRYYWTERDGDAAIYWNSVDGQYAFDITISCTSDFN